MTGWAESTLGNVAEVIPGYAFKGEHFGDAGATVIKIKDITPPTVSIHDAQKVDLAHYSVSKLEKFKLQKGDFVVAMTGATIGKVGRLLEEAEVYINQRVAKIEPKPDVDKDFVYFCLLDSGFDDFVQNNIDSHSAQENISGQSIGRYPINLPLLPEQKAIAAVLSSLDDKIDLLHRQNKTLEAMAETLFRQWFVEEVYEDWEDVTLGDIASNIRSSVKTTDISPDIKYVGLEHIDRRNIALKQYGFGEEVGSNKSAFEVNDILFGKLRPYFHKVCFAPFAGICSTDILVMRPKRPEHFPFCLFAFFQDDVVEYANLGSGGTRMPRTDWTTLKSYAIAKPDAKVIERFNGVALPAIERIAHNLGQIRTLEKLRDTLLPKLMSGEVRVAYERMTS